MTWLLNFNRAALDGLKPGLKFRREREGQNSSFPRRRESRNSNKLDPRLREDDGLIGISLGGKNRVNG